MTVEKIQAESELIDSDTSLHLSEFDTNEIYKIETDGSGILNVYKSEKGIHKIEQKIGFSFGVITTIIYLKESLPILIMEREENFEYNDKIGGFDYTKLNKVFEAKIFVFDWENDQSEIVKTGKRVLSEGNYSTFEYESIIEMAEKLTTE